MPTYEYLCLACRRPVTLFFRSFAAVEAEPACPHCSSRRLERRMSRAFIRRGSSTAAPVEPDEMYGDLPVMHAGGAGGWDAWGSGSDDASHDLAGEGDGEDEDIVGFARQARHMAAMMGEPLDAAFDTALQHIEGGADVEDVFGELDAHEAQQMSENRAADKRMDGPSAAGVLPDDPS